MYVYKYMYIHTYMPGMQMDPATGMPIVTPEMQVYMPVCICNFMYVCMYVYACI
jgi:hypothetical protein